jgi:hypothetical protein
MYIVNDVTKFLCLLKSFLPKHMEVKSMTKQKKPNLHGLERKKK